MEENFFISKNQITNQEPESLIPEEEKKGGFKKVQIFLVLLISLGGLIITGIYFGLFNLLFKENGITPRYMPSPSTTTQAAPSPTLFFYSKPPQTPSSLGFESTQIAYIKENDIWLIKADGSSKIKLPKESHTLSFFVLEFRDKNNLSYTQCSDSCKIYNYNLEEKQETLLAEPPTATGYTRIENFGQSFDGNYIAFFYTPPNGKTYLGLKTPSETKIVKELGEIHQEEKSLNDQIEIRFSQNGEKFLIVNNILETDNIQTTYLFNKNGEEIDTEGSKEFQEGNFPIFFDEKGETIIYIYNDLLYKTSFTKVIKRGEESIQVKKEKVTPLENSYDLSLSPNKQKLVFIKYGEEKKFEVFTYNFEKEEHEKIIDGLKNPHWLDDRYLLMEKIAYCEKDKEGCDSFGFKRIGLSILDTEKKKIISDFLLEENIHTFAVSL